MKKSKRRGQLTGLLVVRCRRAAVGDLGCALAGVLLWPPLNGCRRARGDRNRRGSSRIGRSRYRGILDHLQGTKAEWSELECEDEQG